MTDPSPRAAAVASLASTLSRAVRWFEQALGVTEEEFRHRAYMAAVARCFPGKAKGGGDRKPDPGEILRCRTHLEREVAILEPSLILPVGELAALQVLGHKGPLASVIGEVRRAEYHGIVADVICLPHPSGASSWHKTEPGISLLQRALRLIAEHPEVHRTFCMDASAPPSPRGALATA
ncbi:uracil-DNA glycosylase family protein [Sorangium sp. So ce1128]